MSKDAEIKQMERAEALCEVERWREAIHEFSKLLTIDPHHYRALCHIARCYLQLNEYEKALDFAEKAIEIDPNQEWAFRLQSYVYEHKKYKVYDLNKYKKKSFEAALNAVKSEPESTFALQTLAYAQLRRRKFKEADKTAQKLRELAPDSAESHNTLGYIKFNQGNFAQAELNFRQALKLEPTNYDTLNILGEVLMKRFERTGSFKVKKKFLHEGIDFFRQAITINPTRTEAKENLKKANMQSAGSSGLIILPIFTSLMALIIFFVNKDLKPEFLNVDVENRSVDVYVLHCISWVMLIFASWAIVIRSTNKDLSDDNRSVIEVLNKPKLAEKLVLGFWLMVSTYPLIFLIIKLINSNLESFLAFKIFDWTSFILGLTCMFINFIAIFPNLFPKKSA